MTNEQRIRNQISTAKGLAEYLVVYNDGDGMHYTSDCECFDDRKQAIEHEIDYLRSESE